MKLIALKDFANVPSMEIKVESPQHDNHIHKGATFDIGTGKVLKELSKADQFLVAQLTVAGCVGDATDAKVVKAVNEEIALDKKRAETAAKLNSAASGSALVEQLTALFKKASEAKS